MDHQAGPGFVQTLTDSCPYSLCSTGNEYNLAVHNLPRYDAPWLEIGVNVTLRKPDIEDIDAQVIS
jgi:hypothetical protein